MARQQKYNMEEQTKLLNDLIEEYGDVATSKQILDFTESRGVAVPYFILRDEKRKMSRGKIRLCARSEVPTKIIQETVVDMSASVTNITSKRALNITESFIPQVLDTYVPFGFYNDLRDIINSKIFYPVYITGHSGNGKTLMVEQICASLGRELIRANVTKRTDESDLIGSYELINGDTVRREGPVITAMRRGAILLLDEVDLGTEDLLCLQPILEGKPYFDKRTGEVITPAAGFNVVATANTKGKGDADGRYLGTNVMNEAMLERFALTEEQEYPDSKTERKILKKNFEVLGIDDDGFVDCLVKWAEVIRKSFNDGVVDEVITTRRLVHITKAFKIFKKNRMKAIEKCLNRFDTETKSVFIDFYTKVDADHSKEQKSSVKLDYSSFEDIAESLTKKYKNTVDIGFNNFTKEIEICAFGRTTTITEDRLKKSPSVLLEIDEIVSNHQFLMT